MPGANTNRDTNRTGGGGTWTSPRTCTYDCAGKEITITLPPGMTVYPGDGFKPVLDKMRATTAEVANKAAGTE